MTPQNDKLKSIIEEFREKVNEVRREIDWGRDQDSPIHEFGLKTLRDDELFTITDFGNIEKWLVVNLTEYGASEREAGELKEHERMAIEKTVEGDAHYERGKAAGREEAIMEADEIKEALALMYQQYCSEDGHWFMSAGERASLVLEEIGMLKPDDAGRGEIIWDALSLQKTDQSKHEIS